MNLILVGAGVLLIVFGGIVLLRFADRPGGSVKLLSIEVTSAGAGLPLIALGVACLFLGVRAGNSLDETDPPRAEAATSADQVELQQPPSPSFSATAGDLPECFASVVGSLPADRVQRIELGTRDLQVIASHQPLEEPFGLVLTENDVPIAAQRWRLYRTSNLYRLEEILVGSCAAPTRMQNFGRGGDPRDLVNWDTLSFWIGEREYSIRIGGEGSINVGEFQRIGGF
jgi:hypothetical protein